MTTTDQRAEALRLAKEAGFPAVKPTAHVADLYMRLVDLARESTAPQEPVAFMFVTKKGGTRREFAAIEYWEENGETIVSKTPLFSAPQPQAAPQAPVQERQDLISQHILHGGWKCAFCGFDGHDNVPMNQFCTNCRRHK
jgi:hypothetical protein